jgi:hypothetical protein
MNPTGYARERKMSDGQYLPIPTQVVGVVPDYGQNYRAMQEMRERLKFFHPQDAVSLFPSLEGKLRCDSDAWPRIPDGASCMVYADFCRLIYMPPLSIAEMYEAHPQYFWEIAPWKDCAFASHKAVEGWYLLYKRPRFALAGTPRIPYEGVGTAELVDAALLVYFAMQYMHFTGHPCNPKEWLSADDWLGTGTEEGDSSHSHRMRYRFLGTGTNWDSGSRACLMVQPGPDNLIALGNHTPALFGRTKGQRSYCIYSIRLTELDV